jgi:hypothetical protein
MSLASPSGRSRRPATTTSDSLADDLIDSYVAWREASACVQAAYERWAGWEYGDRDVGFGGFLAALQQEENAARVYQRQIERVRGGSGIPVARPLPA